MRKTTTLDLELKNNMKPVYSRPYPVPRVYKATLKKEFKRLVKLGVLEEANDYKWEEPSFDQPRAKTSIKLLIDFRNLNMQLKRKPYPIPKVHKMLLKLEGF